MDVTVAACRPTVINHYMLYPGERRVIRRSLADRLLAEQPGCIVIIGQEAEPDAPVIEAPQATKRARKSKAAE